jgi:methylthioribose-1-phosphate isomerase
MTDSIADPAGYRALTLGAGHDAIEVIDQRALPHARVPVVLRDVDTIAQAIRDMWIRGAPLIGAVAACGYALGLAREATDAELARLHALLDATRPTAVNLRWALDRVRTRVAALPVARRAHAAWQEARAIVDEDVALCHAIGRHGLALIEAAYAKKQAGGQVLPLASERNRQDLTPVRILTHCNAGALATCGWGTATAPIFLAHAAGIPIEVWVSETRPRLQGANLTAWEMGQRGIAHTLIVDDAGAFLMQRGEVDLVLVGADRVAANGDVCNKIGTYAKAVAARDCGVPFYAAVPSPTLDPALASGSLIPIEARDEIEVLDVAGRTPASEPGRVRISPAGTRARNLAFDVTPARLLTGLITERGIHSADRTALAAAFPERFPR